MVKKRIFYFVKTTPIGKVYIGMSDKGICLVSFENFSQSREISSKKGEHIKFIKKEEGFPELEKQLEEYFSKKRKKINVTLDLCFVDSHFERNVLKACFKIPYGKKSFYSQIAEEIGRPRAVRAVGNALGKNPIAIIIPCHRVVAKDGSIGGFSGRLWRKKKLLKLEGILK